MLQESKSVLVLAPHTDDGELGAGGLISRLKRQEAYIHYVAFSTCEESVSADFPSDILAKEVRAATEVLGVDKLTILSYRVRRFNERRQDILEDMIKLRRERDYDLVLLPSSHDVHQDHAVISQEGTRAFKKSLVLGYELVWNFLDFSGNFLVALTEADIDQKCSALAKYDSQAHRDYMSARFITSLAHARGVQIGIEYAEAFEFIRAVVFE